MKITFEATLDDFVDIAMRSGSTRVGTNYFLSLALIAIGAGVVFVVPVYLISGKWSFAAIVFVAAASGIVIYNSGNRERVLRRAFAEKGIGPKLVTAEITAEGLSFNQRAGDDSESTFHPWASFVSIQETPDTIYFKRKNGLYSAVRKRGFASEQEKNEFLALANQYRKPREHID